MAVTNSSGHTSRNFNNGLLIKILLGLFCLVHAEKMGKSEENSSKGFVLDLLLFKGCGKCRCGVPNRGSKLLGGEYLRSYEFPWLSLIHTSSNGTVLGSIINDRYIITAATPLVGLTEYEIKVTLGQFDRCSSDVTSANVSIESIQIHPRYGPDDRANDLALLRTSSVIIFEPNIASICLPTPGTKYLGQVATAVGWAEKNEKVTCRPRKIGLPVLDREECLGTASSPHTLGFDKGCVGVIGAPSMLCKTDVGSPVLYRSRAGIYEIIGIGVVTDKNDCSDAPSTSMFTNLNSHMSWIVSSTKEGCFCSKL